MNIQRMKYMRSLLVKAAVQKQDLEVPYWRFDGEPVRSVKEAALVLGVPLVEAKELLSQKDVYAGAGAGAITSGVGSKRKFAGICQRANALAYGNRRRRRKHNKEKK